MAQKIVVTKVEEFDKASTSYDDGEKTELSTGVGVRPSDESFDPKTEFDSKEAWQDLLNIPSCGIIYIREHIQKSIGLEIGINVSQEFPWKQVKLRTLLDHLDDIVDGWADFQKKIKDVGLDEFILIGFANHLCEDDEEALLKGDLFVAFGTHNAALEASKIIKTIETYDRWVIQKQLEKYPGSWISLGSEKEVDATIPKKGGPTVDVEVQSVYPVRPYRENQKRTTNDVRDGYIELLPGEKKFENVYRKRLDIGVQSAPKTRTLEQQTDPTFPANAWAQYLYEISSGDEGLDQSDEEEKKPGSKAATPTPEQPRKPPPEMSNQVKQLLRVLEFNQIDMYRNDYPLIGEKEVSKYVAPYMEEAVSFANIEKSFKRYVSGVSWFPTISGVVVVSYTFRTLNSPLPDEEVDTVQRVILEPNPVLLWSFNDTLDFKLEFVTPREITCLSFCPYDENILVGGAINGQIILWDLQDRVLRMDQHEILTPAQSRYRALMQDFLAWTKPMNEEITLQPDAVSVLETSQSGPIVQINWFSRGHYITKTGKVYETAEKTNRCFATTSFDGSIAFWTLDVPTDAKGVSSMARRKLPAQLMQNVSPLKKLDRVMKPEYMLVFSDNITGCILDEVQLVCKQKLPRTDPKAMKVPIIVKLQKQQRLHTDFYLSCAMGKTYALKWEGYDINSGEAVNKETIQLQKSFPVVHDGFILGIERNRYNKDIFITYGKFIFALWMAGVHDKPIFWRKTECIITSIKWSLDRPSVFFLSKIDGYVEAWDFHSRSDAPSLVEPLGGGLITAISEHWLPIPVKVLGIGDYNSSFRMIELPPSYQTQVPDESQKLDEIFKREYNRKEQVRQWQQEWFEKNDDIIQAKRMAEEQVLQDLERLKREATELVEKRAKIEADEKKKLEMKAKSKAVFDLPERLEQKWDEMKLQRYMDVLMDRKRVDSKKLEKQTVLEKDRLKYEKEKKTAFKRSLKKIDEEISAARAMLLPVEKKDIRRSILIGEKTSQVLKVSDSYDFVRKECDKSIEIFPKFEDLKYHECLDRGRLRQEAINSSLGANIARRHFYKHLRPKQRARFQAISLGFQQFLSSINVADEEGVEDDDDQDEPDSVSESESKPTSAEEENPN